MLFPLLLLEYGTVSLPDMEPQATLQNRTSSPETINPWLANVPFFAVGAATALLIKDFPRILSL